VKQHIYGRQPAAPAYRQEWENILLEKFGPAKYQFQRGRIDACLIHHIDDFDVCGPTEAVKDLLENQLEKSTPLMVVWWQNQTINMLKTFWENPTWKMQTQEFYREENFN